MITGGFFSLTGRRVSVSREEVEGGHFVVRCGDTTYTHGSVDTAIRRVLFLCGIDDTDPRIPGLRMALSQPKEFLR